MAFLDDIVPSNPRGVIRISNDCTICNKPVPVLGLPGKGRPLTSFAPAYFCEGHALPSSCAYHQCFTGECACR